MSFGGFLENKSGSGGARNVSVISYNNNNDNRMPFGAISQPRLVTTSPNTLAKSMFNSPGLSLALVRNLVSFYFKKCVGTMLYYFCLFLCFFLCLQKKKKMELKQQTNIDGQEDVIRIGENNNFEPNGLRRSREEEHESRSGSDNMDGGSGDEHDASDKPPRKKRYHRHTPQQIQELEAYFHFHPPLIHSPSFSFLLIQKKKKKESLLECEIYNY